MNAITLFFFDRRVNVTSVYGVNMKTLNVLAVFTRDH